MRLRDNVRLYLATVLLGWVIALVRNIPSEEVAAFVLGLYDLTSRIAAVHTRQERTRA